MSANLTFLLSCAVVLSTVVLLDYNKKGTWSVLSIIVVFAVIVMFAVIAFLWTFSVGLTFVIVTLLAGSLILLHWHWNEVDSLEITGFVGTIVLVLCLFIYSVIWINSWQGSWTSCSIHRKKYPLLMLKRCIQSLMLCGTLMFCEGGMTYSANIPVST